MKIKDTQLRAVIDALEADLNKAYETSKKGLLAKAEEEKEPAESTDDSASPPASAEATSPPADGMSNGPGAEMPPAPHEFPEAPPSAPEGAADPAQEGQEGEQAPTPEALQMEYSQLPPDQLKMHLEAAMAAMQALEGAGGQGQPPAPAAPMAPPAGPPAGPPPAMKADLTPSGDANGTLKSELSGLKAEMESLKKSLTEKTEDVENLTKAVKLVLERPERKAVTGISYLGKSEVVTQEKKSFTPAEARQKLNDLIPSLSKSERAVVLDFYEGRVGPDKLEAILSKAK